MLNLSTLKGIFFDVVEKLSLIKFISVYVQNIISRTVPLFKCMSTLGTVIDYCYYQKKKIFLYVKM